MRPQAEDTWQRATRYASLSPPDPSSLQVPAQPAFCRDSESGAAGHRGMRSRSASSRSSCESLRASCLMIQAHDLAEPSDCTALLVPAEEDVEFDEAEDELEDDTGPTSGDIATRVALDAFQAVENTRMTMLPELSRLGSQEATLNQQALEHAARLTRIEKHLRDANLDQAWSCLHRLEEEMVQAGKAVNLSAQIAELHDKSLADFRSYFDQVSQQDRNWQKTLEQQLNQNVATQVANFAGVEMRLGSVTALVGEQARKTEEGCTILMQNYQSQLEQETSVRANEVQALTAQVRSLTGLTEAVTTRTDATSSLQHQLDSTRNELQNLQACFSQLSQQMKALTERPPVEYNSGAIQVRLQCLETALTTHERTLSGRSEAQQAQVQYLQGQLACNVEVQAALRQEISLLREENSQVKAACENTQARLEVLLRSSQFSGGSEAQPAAKPGVFTTLLNKMSPNVSVEKSEKCVDKDSQQEKKQQSDLELRVEAMQAKLDSMQQQQQAVPTLPMEARGAAAAAAQSSLKPAEGFHIQSQPHLSLDEDLRRLCLGADRPPRAQSEKSDSSKSSICPTVASQRLLPPRGRFGPPRGPPQNYWEEAVPSASPSISGSVTQGPVAHVNMINGGQQQIGVATMHPVLVNLWRNMKKPKFTGLPKDVAQFVRDWAEVEQIIHSSSSQPVTDYAMLMELRGCLDEASSETLKSRMMLERDLRYQEYWDSFRQEWGVDAQKQNRADWRNAKLVPTGPKGSEVTLGDWRKFQARFVTARGRVADRTWAEEHQLVFCQLTPKMQETLVHEQSKRRRSRPWVSLCIHESARLVDVLQGLEGVFSGTLPPHFSTKTGCVFRCANTSDRDRLLQFSEYEFDGHIIQISRFEYEMSGDEVFTFFLERLREEQELLSIRQSYGVDSASKFTPTASPGEHEPKVKIAGDTAKTPTEKEKKSEASANGKASQVNSTETSTKSKKKPNPAPRLRLELEEANKKVLELEAKAQSRAFNSPVRRGPPPQGGQHPRSPYSPGRNQRTGWQGRESWSSPPFVNGTQLKVTDCWHCGKKGLRCDHDYKTCPSFRNSRPGETQALLRELQELRAFRNARQGAAEAAPPEPAPK